MTREEVPNGTFDKPAAPKSTADMAAEEEGSAPRYPAVRAFEPPRRLQPTPSAHSRMPPTRVWKVSHQRQVGIARSAYNILDPLVAFPEIDSEPTRPDDRSTNPLTPGLRSWIPDSGSTSDLGEIANLSPSHKVAAGTVPPPLPPSVEEAYRKKCIELKRRMQEVEESNDAFRVRKARLARGIRKMRLERAYLLEMLGKRMRKNGNSTDGFLQPYDEESDGSSEGPPTVSSPTTSRPPRLNSLTKPTIQPHEKPLRSKRSHRRPASSPPPNLGHQHPRPIAPSQAPPTSVYEPPRDGYRDYNLQHVPTTNGHPPIQYHSPPGAWPRNPAFPPGPPLALQTLSVPQSAFTSFVEGYIKRHPDTYQYQTQEELLQIAQNAWEDPYKEEYRHFYEEKHQREVTVYERQRKELEKMERERQAAWEAQGPPPSETQQPREAPAGVGGFTSING